MQLHDLKVGKKKKRKRVGRGGKRGTYSGRGMKGQKSRAGRKLQPAIREFIKKYPKLRGYSFNRLKDKPSVVNLGIIDKKFESGEKITPLNLLERRIIRRIKGRIPKVKILGEGEVSKKLFFEDCSVSQKAKEKIEKAGGKII